MIKSSAKKEESDSESEALPDGWKRGVNLVHRQYNGMHSDKEVNNIENDQLKGLQKKAKKAEKSSQAYLRCINSTACWSETTKGSKGTVDWTEQPTIH